MTREAFDEFLSKIESAGIKSYGMYVCGGNLTIVHEDPTEFNKPTGMIIDKGEYVIALQRSREYMSTGKYDMVYYPLDMCDAVFIRNLDAKTFMTVLGSDLTDDAKSFISKAPGKRVIRPIATTTIGEENTHQEPTLNQYDKQETIVTGTPYESPYHTINNIDNLPETDNEVYTVPERASTESTEG